MTKMHFIALARALHDNIPNSTSETYAAEARLFGQIVGDVARVCASVNPRFDRNRFTRASGLDELQSAKP